LSKPVRVHAVLAGMLAGPAHARCLTLINAASRQSFELTKCLLPRICGWELWALRRVTAVSFIPSPISLVSLHGPPTEPKS
jgi:hypothetical protein